MVVVVVLLIVVVAAVVVVVEVGVEGDVEVEVVCLSVLVKGLPEVHGQRYAGTKNCHRWCAG